MDYILEVNGILIIREAAYYAFLSCASITVNLVYCSSPVIKTIETERCYPTAFFGQKFDSVGENVSIYRLF